MTTPSPALKLLVVEDDPAVMRAAVRYLEHRGHSVIAARNATTARGLDGAFDCLVLDIDLPDGSGLELAVELLRRSLSDVVVFFSGTTDVETRLSASELGTFVPKEAGLHALAGAVETAVREVRAGRRVAGGEGLVTDRSDPRFESGWRKTR
ncbi:MAG: response regulator [Polyangiaceae bacterium]|nr:response regulator [Polyangiaceae bacterium]